MVEGRVASEGEVGRLSSQFFRRLVLSVGRVDERLNASPNLLRDEVVAATKFSALVGERLGLVVAAEGTKDPPEQRREGGEFAATAGGVQASQASRM